MNRETTGAPRAKARRSALHTMRLGEQFRKRLESYVATAGAAGVAIMGVAQPAKAEIAYFPVNERLTTGAYLSITVLGTPVINLHNEPGSTTFGPNNEVWASGFAKSGNGVEGQHGAAALKLGAPIGASDPFSGFGLMVYRWNTLGGPRTFGAWANVKQRYLGFEFKFNGQEHYGWARLTVINGPGVSINTLLTGYAFNTIAGQKILAGQTHADLATQPGPEAVANQGTPQLLAEEAPRQGTLGLLALGSLGLPYWRRKEPSSTLGTRG